MTSSGFFLSLEGTEGSGKTTQMRLLVDRLRAAGHVVVLNQEPGGTEIGKQIRRILLDPANDDMAGMTELLLMFASRTQAAAQVIEPALQRGAVVVSDRFTDSSLAYQGVARGLGIEQVLALHHLALGSLLPDLTICLSIDVAAGLARANRRNQSSHGHAREGRIDSHSLDFHAAVLAAYERIANAEPERFRMVDASGEPGVVGRRVWDIVAAALAHSPSLASTR